MKGKERKPGLSGSEGKGGETKQERERQFVWEHSEFIKWEYTGQRDSVEASKEKVSHILFWWGGDISGDAQSLLLL